MSSVVYSIFSCAALSQGTYFHSRLGAGKNIIEIIYFVSLLSLYSTLLFRFIIKKVFFILSLIKFITIKIFVDILLILKAVKSLLIDLFIIFFRRS